MPRLIDADALLSQVKRSREKNPYTGAMLGALNAVYDFTHRDVLNLINSAHTIDAEPVRHSESTTFIDTDNLEGYASRIIVGQGRRCYVYYADTDEPVRHGRWEPETSKYIRRCSACEKVTFYRGAGRHYDYCPNCGAKMNEEVEG